MPILPQVPYQGTPLIDIAASYDHPPPPKREKNNYNFGDGRVDYEDTWTRLHTEWQITPNALFSNDTYFIDVMREWQNL